MKISISAANVSTVITSNDGVELINYSTDNYKLEIDVAAIISSGATLMELFQQVAHKAQMEALAQMTERRAAQDKFVG